MKYLSVCSGIEAATVAWHPLGWQAVAYSEIEKFPSEVLAHHYPDVPNVGDMTKFKEWNFEPIDLFVGGTPCQSFSLAGLRKGLDDPRGNLMLTYLAIADKYRPRWLVWENVPGVLSSNRGKDFGTFLGGLAELGYGFAYRVLDAQYFGVAQRRRRVFVVGYLGDWRLAAAVLFERHSLSGHPAPSRETRQDATKSAGASTQVGSLCARTGLSNSVQDAEQNHLLPTYGIPGNWIGRKPENGGNAVEPMLNIAPCLTKTDQHGVAQPMVVHGTQDPCVSNIAFAQGRNNGAENVLMQPIGTDIYNASITGDVATTLTKRSDGTGTGPTVMQPVAAFNIAPGKGALKDDIHITDADISKTIDASGSNPSMHQGGAAIVQTMAVRRLTPKECERLQGFPDNYTDIKPKGKDTPDGPRYKALGNSMAVPVMAWIGKRIQEVENL